VLTATDLFPASFDPISYLDQFQSFRAIPSLEESVNLSQHQNSPHSAVDPTNFLPFPPDLGDLARLHWLVTSRSVLTVLEFGTGFSTVVFSDALFHNRESLDQQLPSLLRRQEKFEIHSIDNNQFWLDSFRTRFFSEAVFPSNLHLHKCDLDVSHFNGRVCTYYDPLPDLCPDLIYIDGPDQFSSQGSLRGISTRHPDRMPMSGDLLALEHFLQPGTLVVIDGRSANARFLTSNLQRNWSYLYIPEFDQHFLELQEDPLGRFNAAFIDFTLGDSYYQRMSRHPV